jgi:hypothetical protein
MLVDIFFTFFGLVRGLQIWLGNSMAQHVPANKKLDVIDERGNVSPNVRSGHFSEVQIFQGFHVTFQRVPVPFLHKK